MAQLYLVVNELTVRDNNGNTYVLSGKNGKDGKDGKDGTDGVTPHIGNNSNWWFGETDSGKSSRGPEGKRGPLGLKGDKGDTGATGPAGANGIDGINGVNGTSRFISLVFKRSSAKPTTPVQSEGSYANPVPAGWYDSIPELTTTNSERKVWMTKRVFTDPVTNTSWSEPTLILDSSDFDVCYSKYEYPGSLPLQGSNVDNLSWHNVGTSEDIWMATATRKSGASEWSNWVVTRIKGEKGNTGEASIIADFDNEMDSIVTASSGYIDPLLTLKTTVSMYVGTTLLYIKSIAFGDNKSNNTTISLKEGKVFAYGNNDTGLCTFSKILFNSGFDRISIPIYVTSTYSGTSYTRELKFTINRVRAGEKGEDAVIYKLAPSAALIKVTSLGTQPSLIKCNILETKGSKTSVISAAYAESKNLYIKYGTNNCPVSSCENYTLGSGKLVDKQLNCVNFHLYMGSDIIDSESIPLVKDGENGAASVICDLTNELDTIIAGSNGKFSGSLTCSTSIILYEGTTALTTNISKVEYKVGSGDWTTIENNTAVQDISITSSQYSGNSYSITLLGDNVPDKLEIRLTAKDTDEKYLRSCIYTISKLKLGKSNPNIKLNSELGIVPVDQNHRVLESTEFDLNASLLYEGNNVNITGIKFEGVPETSDIEISCVDSNNNPIQLINGLATGLNTTIIKPKIKINASETNTFNKLNVSITLLSDDLLEIPASTDFSIYGVEKGQNAVMYSLVPNYNVISNPTSNTVITCYINKYEGNTPVVLSKLEITSLGLKVFLEGNSKESACTVNGAYLISVDKNKTSITIVLKLGEVIVDKETIPIIKDGALGNTGKSIENLTTFYKVVTGESSSFNSNDGTFTEPTITTPSKPDDSTISEWSETIPYALIKAVLDHNQTIVITPPTEEGGSYTLGTTTTKKYFKVYKSTKTLMNDNGTISTSYSDVVEDEYATKLGSKTTYIGEDGIYTGTLTADLINAIKIDASLITAGTIDSERLNVTKVNADEGTIGEWNIDASSIYSNNLSGEDDCILSITLSPSGVLLRNLDKTSDSENSDFGQNNLSSYSGYRMEIDPLNGILVREEAIINGNSQSVVSDPPFSVSMDGSGTLANGTFKWSSDGTVLFGDSGEDNSLTTINNSGLYIYNKTSNQIEDISEDAPAIMRMPETLIDTLKMDCDSLIILSKAGKGAYKSIDRSLKLSDDEIILKVSTGVKWKTYTLNLLNFFTWLASLEGTTGLTITLSNLVITTDDLLLKDNLESEGFSGNIIFQK